jgi:uncharacterized protein
MDASGKRIERWLGSVVPQIVKQAAPLRILLFGSAVRNPGGTVNDLDFLVVVPDRDRPSRIMDRLNSGVRNKPIPCDFLVATPSVLAKHAHRRDSIYKTALSEGHEIYAC